MVRAWTPLRGIAAWLFWFYYRILRQGREVLPI